MPKKIRMEFISAGFRDILLTENVRQMVKGEADRIANAAGDGYKSETMYGNFGGGRIVGFAVADTYEAMLDEAENHTLEEWV